jgi:hypothetical protein
MLLGSRTLAQLNLRLGQTVDVSADNRKIAMYIAGRVLMPIGYTGVGGLKLGDGAIITAAAFRRLAPDDVGPGALFAVRYAPGANRGAAFASLRRDFGRAVATWLPGEEVESIRRVDYLPLILAALLLLLAVATTGHALISLVRRKARDLAILKTLGFLRSQLSATVAWQATALATVGLVVGIPLGVVVGRLSWKVMAHSLGAVTPPSVPLVTMLIMIPASLLVANVVAVLPGVVAARVKSATLLRTE